MDSAVPEALLDGIASRPDDPAVWEVLADYLLEQNAPWAMLARGELALLRGISNPELLEEFAQARIERMKLPFEPAENLEPTWRCGYVVKFETSTRTRVSQLVAALRAPALGGLHHFTFHDWTVRESSRTYLDSVGHEPMPAHQRLATIAGALTPHLRRFSLRLEQRVPLPPPELSGVLDALTAALPGKVERLDLALLELADVSVDSLSALARRVKVMNLDGTRLSALTRASMSRLLGAAPRCTFFLAGTGLSSRELPHPRVEWLAPDVEAWLENKRGAFTPLTPARAHDGFHSPSWPELKSYLRRERSGWSRLDGKPLEERALVLLDGEVWKFSSR